MRRMYPDAKSASYDPLCFHRPMGNPAPGECARMYPNVPECTRMYPNVPPFFSRMYPTMVSVHGWKGLWVVSDRRVLTNTKHKIRGPFLFRGGEVSNRQGPAFLTGGCCYYSWVSAPANQTKPTHQPTEPTNRNQPTNQANQPSH